MVYGCKLLGVEIHYESATKIIKEVDETLLFKVVKEFIEEKFSVIDGIEYFIDGNNYTKLITDLNEKL